MSNKKIKQDKPALSKEELLKMFVLMLFFVLLLIVTYTVGVLLYNKTEDKAGEAGSAQSNEVKEVIDPDKYFKDCQLIEARCMDVKCKYYARCGDGHYEACKIYDCGDKIGVYTEDTEGNQKTERQDKPDMAAVAAKRASCKGNMEILSDKCVSGEEKIKVKIVTEGECEITAFTVIYNGTTTKANTFTALGDSVYEITAFSCGKVTKIIPATRGGISLAF